MTLPIGGVHTLPMTTPIKTPWKPRISLRGEVNDLLLQAMAGDSSWEFGHSAMGKEATEEVVMPLSPKLEDHALLINFLSHVSMEEGNTFKESNPVNASPTMAAHSSHINSPLVDFTELQTDANQAANHLLSVKRSTDLRRQGVIWEVRLVLQQNEAEEAALIEKAKLPTDEESSTSR